VRNITIYGDGIIGKLTALSLSDFFNVYIVSEKSKTDSKEAGERYFSINLLSKFMFEKHGLCESLNKKDCYGYSQIITWFIGIICPNGGTVRRDKINLFY